MSVYGRRRRDSDELALIRADAVPPEPSARERRQFERNAAKNRRFGHLPGHVRLPESAAEAEAAATQRDLEFATAERDRLSAIPRRERTPEQRHALSVSEREVARLASRAAARVADGGQDHRPVDWDANLTDGELRAILPPEDLAERVVDAVAGLDHEAAEARRLGRPEAEQLERERDDLVAEVFALHALIAGREGAQQLEWTLHRVGGRRGRDTWRAGDPPYWLIEEPPAREGDPMTAAARLRHLDQDYPDRAGDWELRYSTWFPGRTVHGWRCLSFHPSLESAQAAAQAIVADHTLTAALADGNFEDGRLGVVPGDAAADPRSAGAPSGESRPVADASAAALGGDLVVEVLALPVPSSTDEAPALPWGVGDVVLIEDKWSPDDAPARALVMAENPDRPNVVKVKYLHSKTAAWVARSRVSGLAPAAVEAPAQGEPEHDNTEVKAMEPRMIGIDRIRVLAGHNARDQVGDVSELAASIEELGVLQALLVAPLPDDEGGPLYGLIAGERRLTAARQAGRGEVPCTVLEGADARTKVSAMLAENMQREPLTPLQEASGMQRLVELGMSQREIARQLGCGQSHVSKRLTLLTLPAEIQGAIDQPHDAGGITVAEALELAKLNDHSERQTEAFVRGRQGHYGGVTGQVRVYVEEHARAQARDAARAQLREAGVTLLKEHDSYISWHPGKMRPLRGQGQRYDYEAIKVDVDQHRDQPCHGAVLDRDGQVIYVCTEPERHMDTDPQLAARVQQQQELRAHRRQQNKLQRAATEARRPFLETVLAAANTSQMPFAAQQVLGTPAHTAGDACELACQLLGLEVPTTPMWTNYGEALSRFAGQNLVSAGRAMMALALANGEQWIDGPHSYGSELSRRHLELLVAAGYTPNEYDRRFAETPETRRRSAPEEAEEAERTCRICFCTDDEACEGGCHWVPDPEGLGDICSACLPRVTAAGAPATVGEEG